MKAGSAAKMSRKVLSVFIAVLMLFSMIPSGVLSFAAENSQYEFIVTDDNEMPVDGAIVTVIAEGQEDQEKITDATTNAFGLTPLADFGLCGQECRSTLFLP